MGGAAVERVRMTEEEYLEYVLVAQRERQILHFRRLEGGWFLTEVGPGGTLSLPALGCEVPVAEIYEGAETCPSDED